jgi:hypothetical protein
MTYAILVLAAAAGTAAAQQPSAAAPIVAVPRAPAAPSEETMTAALALFDQKELEDQMMGSAIRVAQVALEARLESLRKRGIVLPDPLVARLNAVSLEEVKSMVDTMLPTFRVDAATIYARYFTADELRELKRLQDNPVSLKLRQLTPNIVAEITKVTLRVSEERMPELERRSKEIVEGWLKEQHITDPGPTS